MSMGNTLEDRRLDALFTALSDPTRRDIVARLSAGEATVKELAEPYAMSMQAVSQHIRVLEQSGLISRGGTGRPGPVGSNRRRSMPQSRGSRRAGARGRSEWTGWRHTSPACRSGRTRE